MINLKEVGVLELKKGDILVTSTYQKSKDMSLEFKDVCYIALVLKIENQPSTNRPPESSLVTALGHHLISGSVLVQKYPFYHKYSVLLLEKQRD